MINMEQLRDKKIKHIIFVAEGGIGKVLCSTAVVKRLSESFPDKKIIVITGYPDIFLYNPSVYKCFNFGNPLYFYDDYVNPESFVIKVEPYTEYDYMFRSTHIIDTWCRMIGIDRNGAMPEMFYMDNELAAAEAYVEKISQAGKKKFVMLQWIGGIIPQEKSDLAMIDVLGRMHRRALPKAVAQKLANKLITRDYVVGSVQHPNFPDIQGTEKLFFHNAPVRGVIALLKYSEGFIGIDSFIHHAAAIFNTPGVVIWGGTSPKKLGYDCQRNLTKEVCNTPYCHRPDSYVFDATSIGSIWNCPYNTKCLQYDADEIIKAYEETTRSKGAAARKPSKGDKDGR